MVEHSPKVSVIMPCYNHGRFVAASMRAVLEQTLGDLELIVVDDTSKDDSWAVVRQVSAKDGRVKLISHERNRGASRSRNDGLRVAQGEYVAFCDADDLWKPEKLTRQIDLLSKHPQYDITYCDAEIIDGEGRLTGQLFSELYEPPTSWSGDLFEDLCVKNFINMQTVVARREALASRLCFDEGIRWVEDWWQWIQLARHHRFLYEPEVMAQYRVHQQSTGLTQRSGIGKNRIKVFSRNLRTHGDMPQHIQAKIWYKMGLELCLMGKRQLGCRFLWHSVARGRSGGLALRLLAKMTARASLESGRLAVPVHP
jgi:alpha-1,3-rhamnosyltransferase